MMPAIRIEGAQFSSHSLALVNRELSLGLMDAGVEVSIIPTEPAHFTAAADPRFPRLEERFFAPLSRQADYHVRHFFPPRFERPDEGKFILMQPWEYGYLPVKWVGQITRNVDEVWCYSSYYGGNSKVQVRRPRVKRIGRVVRRNSSARSRVASVY
ncbi:MAG TPA: hypothetical protein VGS41_16835 [Chthonomonadales bacterium]|nr:hypothetical protein [Chthonomonadales bacterium]